MMTETLLGALVAVRAACDGNDDALMWLDEIEAELDERPSPMAAQAGDEHAKLAAWNAWATQ